MSKMTRKTIINKIYSRKSFFFYLILDVSPIGTERVDGQVSTRLTGLLCHGIITTLSKRKSAVRKEISLRYKELCDWSAVFIKFNNLILLLRFVRSFFFLISELSYSTYPVYD